MDTAIDSTSAICYPLCSDKILTTSALAFFCRTILISNTDLALFEAAKLWKSEFDVVTILCDPMRQAINWKVKME